MMDGCPPVPNSTFGRGWMEEWKEGWMDGWKNRIWWKFGRGNNSKRLTDFFSFPVITVGVKEDVVYWMIFRD